MLSECGCRRTDTTTAAREPYVLKADLPRKFLAWPRLSRCLAPSLLLVWATVAESARMQLLGRVSDSSQRGEVAVFAGGDDGGAARPWAMRRSAVS